MKYLCDPQIIPAVIPKAAHDIESQGQIYAAFSPFLHIDISDGKFTQDSNWPLEGLERLPEIKMHYEGHLMVAEPEAVGHTLVASGVRRLIVHREVFNEASEFIRVAGEWKGAGATEVGCALLINSPLTELDSVIEASDFVQLMSIQNVGHQGEQFDEHVLSRVEEFHARYPDMMVSVDGGISEATVEQLVRAGANRLVIGHVLADSAESEVLYARIHERAMRGCKPQALELSV